MPELQPLRADHAPAVLAFETANRDFFAATISDRGDGFFERFAEVHEARLAEQGAGESAYDVLVDDDGSVLGRFNLIFGENGVAELGYRVAEQVCGRGLATATVGDLCRIAADSGQDAAKPVRHAMHVDVSGARAGGEAARWPRVVK